VELPEGETVSEAEYVTSMRATMGRFRGWESIEPGRVTYFPAGRTSFDALRPGDEIDCTCYGRVTLPSGTVARFATTFRLRLVRRSEGGAEYVVVQSTPVVFEAGPPIPAAPPGSPIFMD
jgi:hypothetical protein